MNKKKKIILITVASIIVLILIVGIVGYVISRNNNKSTQGQNDNSDILSLYNELQQKGSFLVSLSKDDNNKMEFAKQNDKVYIDTTYNGVESEYIIKDGNTYLLKDDSKTYYTYSNNQVDLNKITNALNEIKDLEYQKGKEEVNGKKYDYEEYSTLTEFALEDFSNDKNVKTRFYFDNNNLIYIKTISDEKQELLSFELSDKVDNNLFEIPSDYKEG